MPHGDSGLQLFHSRRDRNRRLYAPTGVWLFQALDLISGILPACMSSPEFPLSRNALQLASQSSTLLARLQVFPDCYCLAQPLHHRPLQDAETSHLHRYFVRHPTQLLDVCAGHSIWNGLTFWSMNSKVQRRC